VDAEDIRAIRTSCTALRALKISYANFIGDHDEWMGELYTLGSGMAHLREVEMTSVPSSGPPFVALLNGLRYSRTLEKLSLYGFPYFCATVKDTFLDLESALAECMQTVRDLSLSPSVYPHSTDSLIRFVGTHCSKLRRLSLPSTRFFLADFMSNGSELLQSLGACTRLEELHLGIEFAMGVSDWDSEIDRFIARLLATLTAASTVFSRLTTYCSYDRRRYRKNIYLRTQTALEKEMARRKAQTTGPAWSVVVSGISAFQEKRLRGVANRVAPPAAVLASNSFASSAHSLAPAACSPIVLFPGSVLRHVGSYLEWTPLELVVE
jgi:hypothetical protein